MSICIPGTNFSFSALLQGKIMFFLFLQGKKKRKKSRKIKIKKVIIGNFLLAYHICEGFELQNPKPQRYQWYFSLSELKITVLNVDILCIRSKGRQPVVRALLLRMLCFLS